MSQMSLDNSFIMNSSLISQPESLIESSQMSTQEDSGAERVSPKTRGWINEHFSQAMISRKKMRVCRAEDCSKSYAAGTSTVIFKNHWRREHSLLRPNLRKTSFMFHNQLYISRLVKLVIARHLEYSLVDQPEFKMFIDALETNKHTICRKTLADIINSSRDRLTDMVCEKLENAESVALTFDIWSARKGSRGFGCITAHYISSLGEMENLILHFKRMKFPHDAETIKKFIEKPLNIFNLQGRIAAITTDNASNNIAAIRMIDDSMGLTSLNLGFVHYKCVAHIIDLGMKNAMKDLKETVTPVRDAVMAIRSSRKRKEMFIDKQLELIATSDQDTKQPLELAEDVDHRWNSAFVLLERASLLRKAIDYMLDAAKGLETIPPIEWATIEEVVLFLKPFNEATKRLCSAKDVTISVVSYIIPRLIEHCVKYEASANEYISAASISLKAKLTDYELDLYHPVVDIAYFLDPRYKTKNMSEAHQKIVIDRMRKLVDEMPMPGNDLTTSTENSILGCDSDTDTEEAIDELKVYRESKRLKMSNDVLMWWKNNSELYPKLSAIARKILPIQGTSVASERVFSVAGDVDTKMRNRLSDESVENIVLFKSWMQYLHVE